MAIRQRITTNPQPFVEDEPVTANVRSADIRGTVDPSKDPFPGSTFDRMGIPKDKAGPIVRRLAHIGAIPTPKQMPVQDLLAVIRIPNNPRDDVEIAYKKRIRSPLTGIRAFCVDCKGGSARAATNCDKVECPLWPFHQGSNAFYQRRDK